MHKTDSHPTVARYLPYPFVTPLCILQHPRDYPALIVIAHGLTVFIGASGIEQRITFGTLSDLGGNPTERTVLAAGCWRVTDTLLIQLGP